MREAATRTQSTNNLKQIALAAHSFHDAYKRFPFNGSNAAVNGVKYSKAAKDETVTSGSWGFQILPYIEQAQIFTKIDRTVPVQTYLCPGRHRPGVEVAKDGGGAWSDYFWNNYLNDAAKAEKADNPDAELTFNGITDGTSNTIMAGHGNISVEQYSAQSNVKLSSNIFDGGTFGTARAGKNGAANPGGVTLQRDGKEAPTIGSWGGPFPGGGLFALCDGSVRTISYSYGNLNCAVDACRRRSHQFLQPGVGRHDCFRLPRVQVQAAGSRRARGQDDALPELPGDSADSNAQATAVTAEPKPAPPAEPVEATDDMVTAEPPRRREPKNAEEDDRPRRRRPREDREDDREPVPAKSIALAVILPIVIVGVLAGCCVVVPILIALLVPAVQKVREAAARTQSTNNLKQIALGYHSYHDAFRRLPFNGSDEQIHKKNAIAGDASSGSWGFQILPFIEQQPVQAALDRNAPIKTFMCPGRGRPMLEINGGAWTDYFYNNYLNDPDHASRPDNPDMRRTLVGITDGTSNTILVGHGNIPIDLYPAAGGVPFSTNIFNGGTVGTMSLRRRRQARRQSRRRLPVLRFGRHGNQRRQLGRPVPPGRPDGDGRRNRPPLPLFHGQQLRPIPDPRRRRSRGAA